MDKNEERAQVRATVAANLEKALGDQWRARTAHALGTSWQNIDRLFNPPRGRHDHPSPALVALSEFLVGCAPEHWPARWRDPSE